MGNLFYFNLKTLFGVSIFLLTTASTALWSSADFCWKGSYGRGVGTIPGRVADCPPTYTNNGLTCGRGAHTYLAPSKLADCPAGYTNMGLTCYRPPSTYSKKCSYAPFSFKKYDCKPTYTDNGCFCGRGASSKGPSSMVCPKGYFRSSITARCHVECRPGYTNTGETCFRPVSTLSLNHMSCRPDEIVKTILGVPRCFPGEGGSCGFGYESQAGLCYKNCRSGYSGVGPVCWDKPPSGWSNCGMGAAIDGKTCASKVFGQVSSVGTMALSVATFGASGAVEKAATATDKAKELSKLRKQYDEMKAAFDQIKNSPRIQKSIEILSHSSDTKKVAESLNSLATSEGLTEADITRLAATIASVVDPYGLAGTVAAYSYPKCNQITITATE